MSTLLQITINGLVIGGVYALVAVGYSLAYGLLRMINFAHGGVFVIGAFTTFVLAGELSLPVWAVAPLVMCVGALLGASIERFAYRPLRSAPTIMQLITGLGLAAIIENACAAVFGSDARSLPAALTESAILGTSLGVRFTAIQAVAIGLSALLLLGLWLLVMHSKVGRAIRAIADDPAGAATTGVPVDRIVTSVFALGSALGALAGMVVAFDVGCDPYLGTIVGFKAFTACVVGGIGSLRGAVVGGLAIGISENLVAGYVSTEYKGAIVMAVLVTLLLVWPEGLWTFRTRTA